MHRGLGAAALELILTGFDSPAADQARARQRLPMPPWVSGAAVGRHCCWPALLLAGTACKWAPSRGLSIFCAAESVLERVPEAHL